MQRQHVQTLRSSLLGCSLDLPTPPRLTVVDGHGHRPTQRRQPPGSGDGMTPDVPIKRCGLVIRVSTDNQARNPEGSLTNQLQRLRAHIEYKTGVCGENWTEAEQYILPGVSGKNSFRSRQFQQLFAD